MPVELTAWGHDPADSRVYVEPSLIPGAKEGDMAELWLPMQPKREKIGPPLPAMNFPHGNSGEPKRRNSSKSSLGTRSLHHKPERKNLYFQIAKPKVSSGPVSTTTKTSLPTISVSSNVLSTLGIRPRSQVRVKVLKTQEERRRVYLDVVEIHFRGVNLTRNDHYKIAKSISGTCVNCGQRVGYLNDSVRLTVDTLFRNGKRKFSGYIGDDTRMVFRSDSARILIFIQMSSEMWNFDESGDIMFHRLVNSFIPEMLNRWHSQGDSHLVSIILFTSVSSRESRGSTHQILGAGQLEKETFHFYRVVVDSVHISRWSDIMRTLRSEFERFPQEVLEDPLTHELRGYFLPSSKGNILEAFSLATTLLTSKFVDRDLCRTGVQAMVATAGPACFDVDLSELWHLSRRLLGVEIGIELVCLARPPLHVTPLFRALLPAINKDFTESEESLGPGNWKRPSNTRLVFCVPTWINMSFWVSPDKYMKQWIPRCRIYDLQMVGLIENEARTLGLKSYQFEADDLTHNFMRNFDAGVFKTVDMIESQKRIEIAAKSADSAELRPKSEGLERSMPASAITTVAVAMPTQVVTRPSPPPVSTSSAMTSLEPSLDNVSFSDTNTNNKSTETGAAKSTLGALLGFRSRKDYGDHKVKKASSFWSALRPISSKSENMASSSSEGSQRAQAATSHHQQLTRDAHSANASNNSKKPFPPANNHLTTVKAKSAALAPETPIYISTPARKVEHKHGRRESKVLKSQMQLGPSPSKQHIGSSALQHSPSRRSWQQGRRGSVMNPSVAYGSGTSPDPERNFSRASVSPSSTGNGGFMNNWTDSNNSSCDLSRPELQNPSMWRVLPNSAIIDNPSRVAAYGRWANVYPPKRALNGVSWHSLKSPASLPLTSASFPSLVSFREHYNIQFYDVAVDSDEMPLPLLLDEMIGLRLQLGFQIAVGSSVRAVEASLPRGNPNRVAPIVPADTKDCIGIRIYMTRMGLVHRLAADDDRTVNVRLYTWIDRNAKWLKSPHSEGRKEDVKVKSRHDSEYKTINKQFLDQNIEHFNWSMLDQQVSGADDPLLYPSSANTQNLVTIRYILVPIDAAYVPGHDTLTVEEGRVEGITRIVRLLLRNREAGSIDSDFIVHYYTGKLSKSIYEIVQDSSSSLEINRLNKSIALEDLAAEMQGAMGLKFRDRRWHWKQFKHVFTGHDFVVWVMKTFEDVNTAEEAEAYGAEVMRQGLIRHPENRHPFIQGHYFYELTPKYDHRNDKLGSSESEKSASGSAGAGLEDREPNNASGNRGTTTSHSGSATSEHPDASAGTTTPTAASSRGSDSFNTRANASASAAPSSTEPAKSETATPRKARAKVHVSESFVVNIDPRGISGRPERVKVSIDRMHNPKNAFHILVEWLSVTPRLIDDLFSNAGRLASQYGLRLVQVPVTDVYGSLEESPFRSSIRVKPAIDLQDPEESRWFRHYLLRRSGYVLDIYDHRDISNDEYEVYFFWGRLRSSCAQYIHSSGFVLVQVENNGHLCITANTLHLSRAVLAGNAAAIAADSECESLMKNLYDLCHDGPKLQELLEEGRQHRMQAKPVKSMTIVQAKENLK